MNRTLVAAALPAVLQFAVAAAPPPGKPMAEPGSPTASLPGDAPPAQPKKLCKAITYTGSRLPAKKVCKTREEWEALSDDTQDGMRDRKRDSRNWKPGAD